MGPLRGIKVLDLSRLLPGPLCTHFLVRLGATVVKVDQPDGGDYVRYIPPMIKYSTNGPSFV
jgi:alpha-methylacyl-CoA racemase